MNSVVLKDGRITFESDHLSIKDKARRNYIVSFLLIIFSTFYGIVSVLSYKNTGDDFMLYSGILLCVLAGGALILWIVAIILKKRVLYRRNYSNTISYQDIDFIKMKRNELQALFVDVIFKNRKRRRIWLKDDKKNTDLFQEFLKQLQVSVQVEPYTF